MVRVRFTLRFVLVFALLGSTLYFTPFFDGQPSKAAMFQSSEYVRTYSGDCVTPQTVFYLGDTVCAEAGDFPLPLTGRFRRFQWSAPNASVADLTSIKLEPQQDKFMIPASGPLAQTGTWYVRTINASSEGHTAAKFVVRNPLSRLADLWITKNAPRLVLPEQRVMYTLGVGNPGPDPAELVEFVTEVPSNMVFVAVRQVSGPFFECSTPVRGETGRIVCRGKGLGLDDKAEFYFYYQVDPNARAGTVCSASSYISSRTEEGDKTDNDWNTQVVVGPEEEGAGDGSEEP